MNVISLFDGMSCLQIAMKELGLKIDNYFASEIDKHAIAQTQLNFPNTIQLGSVVDIDVSLLPKIDFIGGGSPCQSFSFAGKRKGMATTCETEILTLNHYLDLKQQGFEFEGQSYLFWEYMRILTEIRVINPDVKFLLENVEMGEKWEKVLSKAIGVNGIHINSALVSAQNRKRIYWCNFGMEPQGLFGDLQSIILQPKDKGILLKDILESEVDEKYFLSEKMMAYFQNRAANFNQGKINIREEEGKSSCLTSSMASCDISDNFIAINANGDEGMDKAGAVLSRYHKGVSNFGTETYIKIDKQGNVKANQDKASCFTAGGNSGGNHSDMDLIVHNAVEIVAIRGRTENKGEDWHDSKHVQKLEPRTDGKTNSLTSVQKDNLVRQLNPSKESNGKQPFQQNRVYSEDGIMPALNAQLGGRNNIQTTSQIRRLTPTECARLQTIPEWYIWNCSNTQQYRQLGNGWTISVITHILSYLKT